MGLLNQNTTVPPTRYNGIRTAEAILGTKLPLVIGQHRISWKLIWYGDFVSQLAKQQGAGGSGMSKGGTSYVYAASVIGAVCMGPCSNFLGVWDSIGRYAMDTYSETTTVPGGGGTYTPTNATIFRQDLGVGVTAAYSVTANDFGSPGSVTLTGNQQLPLVYTTNPAPGPGQYTVNGSNQYVFNAAQSGATVKVTYVAFRYHIEESENSIVPAGGSHQITVQYQTSFLNNVHVTFYPSGVQLTAVGGTPVLSGTYNPNGGNYLFAPADIGQAVTITYIYRDPNTDTNAPSTLNLTFFGGALGQAAWSYLTSRHPEAALGYSEMAYVASSGMYLGYSPVLPQLNFEILGSYSYGNGIPDASPADAIYGLLTNPSYKLGFPSANIDSSLLGNYSVKGSVTSGVFIANEQVKQGTTGATANLVGTVTGSNPMITGIITGAGDATHTWIGQTSGAIYTPTAAPASSSARAMWLANNFFISSVLDSEEALMSAISRWCEAGQVYMSWDEGKLKFIPLSDTTAVANGITYNPPTQPVIDLDDNDFVREGGQDPINITQAPWQSRWNRAQVRWSVRSNDYNEDILQIQDEASVQQYGLMTESPRDYQFLCTENAAQFAANMRLQRMSAIYTTYNFTLKSNFPFLSVGDIITITDGLLNTQGTMFGRTPVRITKLTDDPMKGIVIEAEQFPWSVGTALLYNKQAQLPSNTNDGPQADPGDTVPVIFEVPNRAQKFSGGKIYVFANGSNVNWGGFQVFVSFNGTDYTYYGSYDTPARIGITTADLPLHLDPDTVDTLSVNMQQSGAVLQSVTAADRDAFITLSALVSPGQVFGVTKTAQTGTPVGTSTGGGVTAGTQGPLTTTSPGQIPAPTSPPGHNSTWTNLVGLAGTSSFAQAGLTNISGIPQSTNFLQCGGFNLSPPTGSGAIIGLQVSFTAYFSSWSVGGGGILVTLAYRGSPIGLGTFVVNGTSVPTSPTLITLGSLSNLVVWGLPSGFLTAAIISDPDFQVQIWAEHSGGGTPSINVQNLQVAIAWAAGGAAAGWLNPGNVSSTVSYASCALVNTTLTQFLLATDFGFMVPFGFILEGIEVTINAYGTSNPATISVVLASDQQREGVTKGFQVTTTPTDYTFGSPTDLWGGQGFWDLDLLNAQGLAGFGVAAMMTGTPGDTMNLNNVRIKLYGQSATNLELISYETAALTGLNTYDLSSLRRGVYGSYPCDHPAASTFARLDQATFVYTIDPTFNGNEIFFKFCSFNAYGNQLQSLAAVTPYVLPVGGLAPGAIDQKTGRLLQGTPSFSTSRLEAAIAAVHGAFGVQNIPSGLVLMGPLDQSTGLPLWQDPTSGAGGGVNDMYIYTPPIAGLYGANQEIFYAKPVRAITLPLGLVGSHAGCRVAPTANVHVTLKKNGVSIGTVDILAGSLVATFTFAAGVAFNGTTDDFTVIAPSSTDSTFAGFWCDFYASRSN